MTDRVVRIRLLREGTCAPRRGWIDGSMLDGVYKLPVQSMKILAGIWFLVFLVLLPCLAGTAYQPDTSQARQPGQRRGALKLPLKDPRIVVIKNKRQLKLYSAGSLVRTYKIGLGLNPVDGAFKFEVQL